MVKIWCLKLQTFLNSIFISIAFSMLSLLAAYMNYHKINCNCLILILPLKNNLLQNLELFLYIFYRWFIEKSLFYT